MKLHSLSEIKDELNHTPSKELLAICLRLAKYKKENKELLSFMLFEAHDVQSYVDSVKNEIEEQFLHINRSNLHYVKKTLRKILRTTNKYIRFAASKESEAEILVHFCLILKASGIPVDKSKALINIYQGQLKKIRAAIELLHEDLQYQYLKQVNELS